MNLEDDTLFEQGLSRLKKPVLPLVNMVQFLYLTGPFETIEEVLSRLTKSVELEGVLYENPQGMLKPYATLLKEFEVIKGKKKLSAGLPFIINEKEEPVAKRQALELWIKQQIISQELETINSLLCGPCGCVLCCTGPNSGFDEASGFKGKMKQEFFEIPLEDNEVDLFGLKRIDTEDSRTMTAQSDPPLQLEQTPFYKHEMALYHWKMAGVLCCRKVQSALSWRQIRKGAWSMQNVRQCAGNRKFLPIFLRKLLIRPGAVMGY